VAGDDGAGYLVTLARTSRDRLQSRIDRWIHPPRGGRHYMADARELVAVATATPVASVAGYMNEPTELHLTQRIDSCLRVNLPQRLGKIRAPEGQWLDVLTGIYGIVRALRPSIVVETGVGIVGATTTFLLQALQMNDRGHLWSVDPDRFHKIYGVHVGAGIPSELRERHTIVVSESLAGLMGLVRHLDHVDIFLHDGCHTYKQMATEYGLFATKMTSGGLVLSDDIWNSALDEFAMSQGQPVHALRYANSVVGLVVVPPPVIDQQASPGMA
jgi:hypothetical protein